MALTRHFPIKGIYFRIFLWIVLNSLYFGGVIYCSILYIPPFIMLLILGAFPIMFGIWNIEDYNQDDRSNLFTFRGVTYKWKSGRRHGEYRPRPEPTRVPWNIENLNGLFTMDGLVRRRF